MIEIPLLIKLKTLNSKLRLEVHKVAFNMACLTFRKL